jgi:hypothetical protein
MRASFLVLAFALGSCGGQTEDELNGVDKLSLNGQDHIPEFTSTASSLTVWFNPVMHSRLVNNEVA